jgi:predicted amidophosphoribosyltransferase
VRYRLYKWFWTAIDWLFPPSCAGCNTTGTRWCQECNARVSRIKPPYCEICGQSLPKAGICFHCKNNQPKLTGVRSWATFKGPLRNALHRIKYQRDIALGETFTIPLIEVLQNTAWRIDLITPVPLGVARQRERGYNQASLLAKPIALKLKIPYLPDALIRTKETLSHIWPDLSPC